MDPAETGRGVAEGTLCVTAARVEPLVGLIIAMAAGVWPVGASVLAGRAAVVAADCASAVSAGVLVGAVMTGVPGCRVDVGATGASDVAVNAKGMPVADGLPVGVTANDGRVAVTDGTVGGGLVADGGAVSVGGGKVAVAVGGLVGVGGVQI